LNSLLGEQVLWFLLWCLTLFSLLLLLNSLWSFLVEFHELGEIELGLLEELDLLEHHVLEGENLSALLLNLLPNGLLDELLCEFLKSTFLAFTHHNLHHLSSDCLLLRALGVARGLNLFTCSSREANAEHPEHVPVDGLCLDEGFNESVPLLHQLAKLVSGDVHAVEVSVAVVALHLFHLNLYLSPVLIVAFCYRSAKDMSNTLPFKLSAAIF